MPIPFGSSSEVIFISLARLAALLGDRPAGVLPYHPAVALHVAHVISLELGVAAIHRVKTLWIQPGDKFRHLEPPEYAFLVAVLPHPRIRMMRHIAPLADNKLPALCEPLEGLVLPAS